ncbi:MAG: AAA family ATPase [Fusobacterium sp.]
MIFKSIKLHNFRQFKDLELNFSTDKEKNVTIVRANNGTGKTTLSQAFTWCLYGDVSFALKDLLNKDVSNNLKEDNNLEILKVEIELYHGKALYRIIRTKEFFKNSNGKINSNPAKFKLFRSLENGNTKEVKESEALNEISNILPEKLARYFLFDGERIEQMSKEVKTGRKSGEFSEAVIGLLGLRPLIKAKEHLEPNYKKSVIGMFNKEYINSGKINIQEVSNRIEMYEGQIKKVNEYIKEKTQELIFKDMEIKEIKNNLKSLEDSKKLEEDKTNLQKKIDFLNVKNKKMIYEIHRSYTNKLHIYFMKPLIEKSINILKEENLTDKDIPGLHSKTIEYLLKEGRCICGNKIEKNSKEYNQLLELLEFLPPQSIGTVAGEFIKKCQGNINEINSKKLFDIIKEKYKEIQINKIKIDEYENEIMNIDKILNSDSVSEKVRKLASDEKNAFNEKTKLVKEKEALIKSLGMFEEKKEQDEKKRKELALNNIMNRKIEVYKEYALNIYNCFSKMLSTQEKDLRNKLELEINKIFKQIYEGGLSISIDEEYRILVQAEKDSIEISTGQSVSVIISFIAGIIKLAREYQVKENNILYSEPYPLVMDAPLSSFDKTRIKNVCEILPKTAEQVIIFIKDTEGDIAKEYLNNKIGEIYKLKKITEFYTELD